MLELHLDYFHMIFKLQNTLCITLGRECVDRVTSILKAHDSLSVFFLDKESNI
jgi:hypothetical protein